MEQRILISVRLPEDLVKKIDMYAKSQSYLNRSKVIINALKAVFQCAVFPSIERIVNCYDPFSEGLEIRVRNIKLNE